MENRKVRLYLKVSEIHITAKFPCTLRFIFRVGGAEVESNEKSKLENGIAIMSKTLNLTIDIGYNSILKEFAEKKVSIIKLREISQFISFLSMVLIWQESIHSMLAKF